MFALKRPCSDCPFRREGGIRVTVGRAREIAGYFTDGAGAMFSCHQTADGDTDDCPKCGGGGCDACDGDGVVKKWSMDWQMCAGGMLFAAKTEQCSNMMRMGIRLGLMQVDELKDRDQIVDSIDELVGLSHERNGDDE